MIKIIEIGIIVNKKTSSKIDCACENAQIIDLDI